MIVLTEKTLYNRRIPKNIFYEKMNADNKIKEMFIQQIDSIIWKHKLSKDTIHIEPTEEVEEIQIFEMILRVKEISFDLLEKIDRIIPYPILYILLYEDELKYVMAYKQKNKNDPNKAVVHSYYQTDWKKGRHTPITIPSGHNLQVVYEQLLKNLIPIKLSQGHSLDDSVRKYEEIKRYKKEIEQLEAKIRKEPQFNRKVKLNMELQKKKNELEEIIREGIQEWKN